MEKPSNNDTYLGRGIHHEKFKKSLLNGNLKQMLAVIKDDNDLDVQLRKDYLNIYYKGGSIAKINSEKSVVFDKFYFYTKMKIKSKKSIEQNAETVKELISQRNELTLKFKEGNYKDYFDGAKNIINKWLEINPKPEREEQHQLSIGNKYNDSDYTIIDLEYQVSTKSSFTCSFTPNGKSKPKKPRFDIIAVSKLGKLCIIELKKGTGALKGTSGLEEHWQCYQESIGKNHQAFMDEMKRVLEQKQSFNLIDEKLKIINPIPEFMFAYSYDKKSTDEKQDLEFKKEFNKIDANIHFLKLKEETFKLMD